MESRTEVRLRDGLTELQRIAALERDADALDLKFDRLMARVNWLIATTFLLSIAIFSGVVTVASIR